MIYKGGARLAVAFDRWVGFPTTNRGKRSLTAGRTQTFRVYILLAVAPFIPDNYQGGNPLRRGVVCARFACIAGLGHSSHLRSGRAYEATGHD